MAKRKLKKQIKDFQLIRELDIVIDNEYDDYKKEDALAKNYAKKWKKGKFDFGKARTGVKNLIVTPRARKYQKEWGIKIPALEREEISKARLRRIMQRLRDNKEI